LLLCDLNSPGFTSPDFEVIFPPPRAANSLLASLPPLFPLIAVIWILAKTQAKYGYILRFFMFRLQVDYKSSRREKYFWDFNKIMITHFIKFL